MKKLPFIKLCLSMLVFGTIGLFVRNIQMERGFIAMVRGVVGAVVLLAFLLATKKKPSLEAIKNNIVYLFLSGLAIGVNWILLFESYSYTTVATSTLCYYMAPVFVIIASPFLLNTKITLKKGLCVLFALLGMVFVSGVFDTGIGGEGEIIGILLALGAALFYATVTILNKKLNGISSYDRTVVQLFFAGVTVLPYTLFCEDNSFVGTTPYMWLLLAVVAIVHTGIAYALFFSSLKDLRADTVAVFSYLDPIVAMFLSVFVLSEPMSPLGIVGAVIILLSTLVSELDFSKYKKG